VNRFVDRIFDDVMIGFFFQKADRGRVKQKEYEFAARHLGAKIPYTGRPIRDAHSPHPIMGGQFNRRLQILGETLEEFGVPENVKRHWLEHTETLRGQVTKNAGNDCDPTFGEGKPGNR
jgi:hemoglobin